MSLLNAQDTTSLNNLFLSLGLTGWQFQTAYYNGYKFTTANQFSNLTSPSSTGLGQASDLISATSSTYDAIKQISGLASNDTYPGGANAVFFDITDSFSKKVTINELPNGKDNIRNLGYNGQTVSIVGLIWGSNYLTAVKNNILNMFFSDDNISTSNPDYHVLVHPFFGRIVNTWLLNVRLIHNSTKWRAAAYELTFRTEQPIGYKPVTNSVLNTINNAINGILKITGAINTLWGTYNNIFNNNPNLKPLQFNSITQNTVIGLQSNIVGSMNNALYVTKLLNRNLSPTNYSNVQLNNTIVGTTNIPQLSYFANHSTPQDINNMLNYLNKNIDATITSIYETNTNNFYDTISLLKSLISQITFYALNLLENYYGQVKSYIIPHDMSMFEVAQLNNLNYENNYQKILSLNQGKLFWLNGLRKNDTILLPTGN